MVALAPSAAAGERQVVAQQDLLQLHPGVLFFQEGQQLTRVYGTTFSSGDSPEASADSFVRDYADLFEAEVADLVPVGPVEDGRHTLPFFLDRTTGEFRFTLVYYSQYRAGIPVFRSDLRLVVRNESGFPLVHASSTLRDLGSFQPANADAALESSGLAEQAALAAHPGLTNFSAPDVVIWAGADNVKVSPVLCLQFEADNGAPATPGYEKYLFLTDAQSGAIVYEESRILNTDVTGNVSGNITVDHRAAACDTEVLTPMPYARVTMGATTVYADASGNFVMPNPGTTQVTLTSEVRGRYFNVNNQAAADASISLNVTPPGPANFVHNPGLSEYTTAEVNAYLEANTVRDMALGASPSYPTIGTQLDWPVNVNLNDTCNAYYDYSSINFFRAGGGCNNTGFGDVVHHEYGHHLVSVGGSGQDAYGEGMGDCMGVLITGRSQLGMGFETCGAGIRNADNTFQYPCSGEIHYCGQLLSGCVWDLRQELQATEPVDWDAIVKELTVNSILLHGGGSITPSITTDFLTIDDDNGDLGDGTPHSDEIIAAFSAHNMYAGPPPAHDSCSQALPVCPGTYTGDTGSATNDGSSACGDSASSPDLWYKYTPISNGTLIASLCSGTSYDSVLSIHTGGCPGTAGTDIGCDDDGCGTTGGPSRVTVGVTAGTTYLIRVTGWSGSAGPFTLSITGPDCVPDQPLSISFPDGLPEALTPNAATSFAVEIADGTETYEPGTGMLNYRYAGGAYQAVALTAMGGDLFEATLPATICDAVPEFYISAESDLGSVVTSPFDAPTTVHSAPVGVFTAVFTDDFDTNLGWTVQNTSVSDGAWVRGVPSGSGGGRGDPPTAFGGSGACYVTGNGVDQDLDGGPTRLLSPTLDLSGAGDFSISYARWFVSYNGSVDQMTVEISNNNGSSWTTVETVPNSGAWVYRTFSVSDFVTPTNQVRMRFTAVDTPNDSVTEAGIDAFSVESFTCESGVLAGDMNCDGVVNNADIPAFVLALTDRPTYEATYPGCNADAQGDFTGDLLLNNADIPGFVDLLSGG